MKLYEGPRVASPEYNQDELSKLMGEVARLAKEARVNVPALPVGAILRRDGDALKFGTLNRCEPTAAGLTVLLPRATAADGGLPVEVAVLSSAGAVTFAAVDALVNGASSVTASPGLGMARAYWDGQGWWM